MRDLRRIPTLAAALALCATFAGVPGAPAAAGDDETQVTSAPASPIYEKPYIKRLGRGAAIGGYMDHEFIMAPGGATFDQHRFIPFIYSAVTEDLHVSAEIEFEHGGFVAGDEETDGEIKIEYAVTDLTLSEAFNVRGGVILSPLGAFNLYHDSPVNDLTQRPLVDRDIVPTTLSESGAGFFGSVYPSELWTVSYEIYAVNGFDEGVLVGADDAGDIDLRVRSGRGSARSDNNNHRSVVARVHASPRLGIDLGASLHSGAYDDAGDETLTIAAFDGRYRVGPVELQGEYALVSAGVSDAAQSLAASATRPDGTPRSVAESQQGLYAQAAFHFADGAVKRFPESVWTAAARYDWVDFDSDLDGDDARMMTAGLNFRPVEDAAFKLDVAWRWNRGETANEWGDAARTGFFSIATYF